MALRNTIDLGAMEAPVPRPTGAPMMIPMADIAEDPDQPRKKFDRDFLKELAEEISERGFRWPISVKLNPAGSPKYLINAGASRYRAAMIAASNESGKFAGKTEVPGFMTEDFDDYEQVNENELRRPLAPMDLALFIQKRINLGDSQAEIARRLRKSKPLVTHHLALLDMPDCMEKAYHAGNLKSAQTIYQLRNIHKKHPLKVEELCRRGEEIIRKDVADLNMRLKAEAKAAASEPEPEIPCVDQPSSDELAKADKADTEKEPRLKSPGMLANLEGNQVAVVIGREPTDYGRVWVENEDGEQREVFCQELELVALVEHSELFMNNSSD